MGIVDRRGFIKTGGVAATLAAASFTGTSRASQSPNDTINVAVMGIRSRGMQLANHFGKVPGVRVATLCDIDENFFPEAAAKLESDFGHKPKTETDIRRVLDDKEIDALVVAAPNHWHALATIWGCQAGKDVYVEKPISHNISEGRKMIEAARKYKRIVQAGTQQRSNPTVQKAMDFIHSGGLGDVYMAKCVIYRPRESFGWKRNSPVPKGVHYDQWVGPARYYPFNENRFHYQWHWFWNTGNGETGNNGPHYTDEVRWALQAYDHPSRIVSMGNYDVFDCEQETPNTQMSVLEYQNGTRVQVEVRNLYSNSDAEMNMGVLLYGSEGWMRLLYGQWETYFGRKNEPGESMKTEDGAPSPGDLHVANFIDCVRSRRREDQKADILEGHLSTSICHLSNIAFRTGRELRFDSSNERFVGDAEADSCLTREYRYPYVVPDKV